MLLDIPDNFNVRLSKTLPSSVSKGGGVLNLSKIELPLGYLSARTVVASGTESHMAGTDLAKQLDPIVRNPVNIPQRSIIDIDLS